MGGGAHCAVEAPCMLLDGVAALPLVGNEKARRVSGEWYYIKIMSFYFLVCRSCRNGSIMEVYIVHCIYHRSGFNCSIVHCIHEMDTVCR